MKSSHISKKKIIFLPRELSINKLVNLIWLFTKKGVNMANLVAAFHVESKPVITSNKNGYQYAD